MVHNTYMSHYNAFISTNCDSIEIKFANGGLFFFFFYYYFFFWFLNGSTVRCEISVDSFLIMAGQQIFVVPFIVYPVEVSRNREAVANGLLAIQRYFNGNFWSVLETNIYSVFVSGVLGVTGHLTDAQVLNIFPGFEPKRWEEKEYLW